MSADTEGAAGPETRRATMVEGVRDAMRTEMARDESVVVLGQDVGRNGGVFRATDGLLDRFGDERVLDTPLAESAIVGSAIGMATHGLRPVAELQFMGFSYPAFDQLVSHAARMRARTRGTVTCPLVVRMPYGAGISAPEHHSESTEALFAHVPGLKVVAPSTPADAKGLLSAAIRDPDPVVVLEPKRLYRAERAAVPAGEHVVPVGRATARREGGDVSVFTYGSTVPEALEAADRADADVEVVDLRTVSPLDREAVRASVERTGRAVVVHEGHRSGGVGAEIAATVQDEALLYLEAPVRRVAGYDVPVPPAAIEDHYLPSPARIARAVDEVAAF